MKTIAERRLLWLACLASAGSVGLAACGGGSGDGGVPAPPPTTVPPPPPPAPPPPTALAPTIVTAPAETSAFAGQTATFSVVATAPSGSLSYQWQRNGVAIAGATAASYSTPPLAAADANAQFAVVVTANGLNTTSGAVSLRVLAADSASRVAAARGAFGLIGLYAPVTAPLYALAPDAAVLGAPALACGSGSVTAATVGGSAPVAGTLLPTGTATPLDVSFAACEIAPRLVVDGNARTQLLAPAIPLPGAGAWSFAATLNNVRTRASTAAGALVADYRAQGGLLLTQQAVVSGSTLTDTVTATPASGLSYNDAVHAQSLTLTGGAWTDTVTLEVGGSRPLLRSQSVQMSGLTYTRSDSVPFAVEGQASVSYTGTAVTPSAGSGEVVVRSNQLVVARVRGTASGFVVALDDGGPAQPFSLPRR